MTKHNSGGDDKFTKKMTKSEEAKFRRENNVPKNVDIVISDKNIDAWRANKHFAWSTSDKPAPPSPPPSDKGVGTLPTKKLKSSVSTPELKKREEKKAAPKPEFKPEPKTKRLSRGGKPVVGSNIATTFKNVANKARFEKEAKGKTAYERSAIGTDSKTSAGLKQQAKEERQAGYRKEAKVSAKGARFARKAEKGRTKYFGK